MALEEKKYKGRKEIAVDPLLFEKVSQEYKSKSISLNEALNTLKISRATFFRRLNKKEAD